MFKKYIIYGFGASGLNVAKYLFKLNEDFILTDDNPESIISAAEIFGNDKVCESALVENYVDSNSTIIFSPGIPLFYPTRHKILDIVNSKSAKIICDIELFYKITKQLSYKNFYIGITGTNGKSTSSQLTYEILKEIFPSTYLSGNIGIACFDLLNKKNFDLNSDFRLSNFVLEISSYQLDLITDTHLDVAALTNITPDHIDRHGSFENYFMAKKSIFKNLRKNDYAVIAIDNEYSSQIYYQLIDEKISAEIIPVSSSKKLSFGISIVDGFLYKNIDEFKKYDLRKMVLRGQHNMENIAISFANSYLVAKKRNLVTDEVENKIINTIINFKGLKHRMQHVGNIGKINFINDSKATNAESTLNALKSYDNIFWILGGRPKSGGIDILKPFFSKITKAYLIGESTKDFAIALKNNGVLYEECSILENAFKKAYKDAKNSGLNHKNILLSPACASFDQWKNFEERGDYFCRLFDEIKGQ